MSRESQRVALLSEVKTFWVPATYGPIAYPNAPFSTPANSRWAEVFIIAQTTDRVSLGATFLKREQGSLQFNLYTPRDLGSRENTEAADAIENHFEELVLLTSEGQKIQFHTPNSFVVDAKQERREGTNANWHQVVVDCPFTRDSVVVK